MAADEDVYELAARVITPPYESPRPPTYLAGGQPLVDRFVLERWCLGATEWERRGGFRCRCEMGAVGAAKMGMGRSGGTLYEGGCARKRPLSVRYTHIDLRQRHCASRAGGTLSKLGKASFTGHAALRSWQGSW